MPPNCEEMMWGQESTIALFHSRLSHSNRVKENYYNHVLRLYTLLCLTLFLCVYFRWPFVFLQLVINSGIAVGSSLQLWIAQPLTGSMSGHRRLWSQSVSSFSRKYKILRWVKNEYFCLFKYKPKKWFWSSQNVI